MHGTRTREIETMMERIWTTKQVISFLMALATGLQLTYQLVEQDTPMGSIDRLLNACVSQNPAPAPDTAHLQAFQASLESGFFAANSQAALTNEQYIQPERNLHGDVMGLSHESFLALVANLSGSNRLELRTQRSLSGSPRKGL
jgi:hypothetical protein